MQLPHTCLRRVCSLLTDDLAKTMASSIVASKLDYCNALLYGAPVATFDILQHVQNNLARVDCRHDIPLARSLYWLPVRLSPLQVGTAGIWSTAQSTLAELHYGIQTAVLAWHLQSSEAPLLTVPRTLTKFSWRAFTVAVPSLWNALLADVWLCEIVVTFKKQCKDIFSTNCDATAVPLNLWTLWHLTNLLLIVLILYVLVFRLLFFKNHESGGMEYYHICSVDSQLLCVGSISVKIYNQGSIATKLRQSGNCN